MFIERLKKPTICSDESLVVRGHKPNPNLGGKSHYWLIREKDRDFHLGSTLTEDDIKKEISELKEALKLFEE